MEFVPVPASAMDAWLQRDGGTKGPWFREGRHDLIVAALMEGRHPAAIAAEHGITRQAVYSVWRRKASGPLPYLALKPVRDTSLRCRLCGERYERGTYARHADTRGHIEQRFWSYVEWSEGCWAWHGALYPTGYGHFTWKRASGYAHRAAYLLAVGPIPEGMHLDHLCRTPRCVNPAHLEPVTPRANVLRSPIAEAANNAAKTHCKHGHSLDDAYEWRRTGRRCRTCHLEKSREQTRRKTEARRALTGRARISRGINPSTSQEAIAA